MLHYVASRFGQALFVLWAAFTVSFILLQAMPGDAIMIKFQNPDLGLSPEQIAAIRASYGADSPLWQQYLHAIGNIMTGNLGYSIQDGVPVSEQLATNLPVTLRLTALSFLLAVIFALAIAFAAHLTEWAWLRSTLAALPALFTSIPSFWLGIILIQIVSFRLKLIPVINPGEWQGLILPVLTVAVPISAPLAQILLRSIDDVKAQPFVAVARAKGASHSRVLWRHIARNAILPALTIAGILLGRLLVTAIVTETVFGLDGLGTLTAKAVLNEDTSVLQAIVLLSALAFVLINLLVDVIFPLLDPRLGRKIGATP
ncbi:ABC transporter permease [Methylovirgula sp. 4M-Z18]|uniref:ABC transporter permease n=1 Tax=Methylovirgula sp. 4M-Z18 TaxID=2293567 RepID=UPI000E2EAB82|nr:ABC transporter permease [Methylovirgula sp. 4M-Z18]RFB79463.1 ABC transporter permease [Methylovirgula sp. 4M-Z18]